MNLITVANKAYINNALKLADSFIRNSTYDGIVHVYLFGYNPDQVPVFNSRIVFHVLDKVIDYADDPSIFFFKTQALSDAITNGFGPFIYLDSRHRVLDRPIEIETALDKHDRFFVQYPNKEAYKLKYLTTKLALQILNAEIYKDEYTYWAAIQAYNQTDENVHFINYMHQLMWNINIAGPSNFIQHPDGPTTICQSHRNDQSLLSILINAYGYSQPFNFSVSSKYGDIDTIRILGGEEGHNWNHTIRGRIDG